MPTASFADELQRFGPEATEAPTLSPRQSRRYCRQLARCHYENFTVTSCLLPRGFQQHFSNIYAYCRWADDLADETGASDRSLELLNWWETQLDDCFRGRATHPVFVALGETIRQFNIPPDPFADLLVAFRQDQRVTRYETFDQLLEYCRYSANPVGRLVLYLGGCHDQELTPWSDMICTGLQLANFWQDVGNDWDRGRVYLPQVHCNRFGYDESMFQRREANEAFRQLLAMEVAEAEGWLRRGLPLLGRVPRRLQFPVALFAYGGLAILGVIRDRNYDVWTERPTVSKTQKIQLVARCWWQCQRGTLIKETTP